MCVAICHIDVVDLAQKNPASHLTHVKTKAKLFDGWLPGLGVRGFQLLMQLNFPDGGSARFGAKELDHVISCAD